MRQLLWEFARSANSMLGFTHAWIHG
jgi:hypothetical protein